MTSPAPPSFISSATARAMVHDVGDISRRLPKATLENRDEEEARKVAVGVEASERTN
jgi:hypothetical protein